MNKVVCITYFYRIDAREENMDIPNRFKILAKNIPMHIFCSTKDKEIFEEIPNTTVHCKELESFEIYKLLHENATELPKVRNMKKDIFNYMCIMNCKVECLKIIKKKVYADHYVWIDAGISKLLHNPDPVFENFYRNLLHNTLSKKLVIPGILEPNNDLEYLTTAVHWRFCGGLFLIPSNLIELFYKVSIMAIKDIAKKTNKAIWEVNMWAYIEHLLPIEWRPARFDESIFNVC